MLTVTAAAVVMRRGGREKDETRSQPRKKAEQESLKV